MPTNGAQVKTSLALWGNFAAAILAKGIVEVAARGLEGARRLGLALAGLGRAPSLPRTDNRAVGGARRATPAAAKRAQSPGAKLTASPQLVPRLKPAW